MAVFYPKLPRRAAFPAILEALYADRVTGFALLQLRNGEPIRVYKVEAAVEVESPAARPSHDDGLEVTPP